MAKKKIKLIIATKEVGDVGNIKRNLPYNVVGNCRLSEARNYLSIRLNGKTKTESFYLGILKKDLDSIQKSSLSVCNVTMLKDNNYILVGSARQTKNQTGISLRVTIEDKPRYFTISNTNLNEILNRRNYVGTIIEYKTNEEKQES